jgi:hypothetical protein
VLRRIRLLLAPLLALAGLAALATSAAPAAEKPRPVHREIQLTVKNRTGTALGISTVTWAGWLFGSRSRTGIDPGDSTGWRIAGTDKTPYPTLAVVLHVPAVGSRPKRGLTGQVTSKPPGARAVRRRPGLTGIRV